MIESSCKAQVTSPPQNYPNGSRTHKYRKTHYWLEDRGQDHAFCRGSGGRFQWRRANANEARKRFSSADTIGIRLRSAGEKFQDVFSLMEISSNGTNDWNFGSTQKRASLIPPEKT